MLSKKDLEMTATASIRAAVGRNMQQERERSMYGCTEAELRNSIESSITFKLSGPAMIAASMMSDAQEEIAHGMDEAARKTLNRAKFVLFTYIVDKE
jgi:hypothetical protein